MQVRELRIIRKSKAKGRPIPHAVLSLLKLTM